MQSVAVDPVRMVLFTSKDCYKCPEVSRIVHRVVGSAMGDSIHVVTVDIDEQPTMKTKYDITALPTILIDDKKVLSGSFEEEDVKTRLWETLLNRGRLREWIHVQKKESMIRITMNMLNSVTKQELIRTAIGDYCHIGLMQQSNLSLLRLDPLVRPLLYRVGKDLGLYGAFPSFCISANPRISSEYRVTERFEEIMQGIVTLFSQPERFPTYVVESVELREIDSSSALLRFYGSALSAGIPSIDEPIDYIFTGIVAGTIEALLGKHVRVDEHDCWGLGSRHCDFLVETAEKPEDLPPSIEQKRFQELSKKETKSQAKKTKSLIKKKRGTKSRTKKKRGTKSRTKKTSKAKQQINQEPSKEDMRIRRYMFQDAIIQIAKQMDDSIFMKKPLRKKLGDFCHIGVIQQPLTALKWLDPFCGTLLYSAGFELGIYGPGKEIIWKTLIGMNKEWPLPLPDAVKVIQSFWSHPLSILTRQHAFVQIVDSNRDKVLLSVNECATASGLPNFNPAEVFCDFQAGYLGGRVDLLTDCDVVVRELQCHGTGHNHCLFEITPV